jgi:hypothetical protein
VGNWQGSAGTTPNGILVFCSPLPKNDNSYEEMDFIFGLPLKNWIIYSLYRILSHDYGDEFG